MYIELMLLPALLFRMIHLFGGDDNTVGSKLGVTARFVTHEALVVTHVADRGIVNVVSSMYIVLSHHL